MNITIIDTGCANLSSVKFALGRLGYAAEISQDLDKIQAADKLLLPGVGTALAAMRNLEQRNLITAIQNTTQPILGICLGMQLMCNYCEEGDTQGLKIFDCDVLKFDNREKVPQIGWNQIENLKSDLFKGIKEKEYMYLVHSFYVPMNSEAIATTNYGLQYASALQEKNFYGVQFHPEKSSKAGAQILKNFLELTQVRS